MCLPHRPCLFITLSLVTILASARTPVLEQAHQANVLVRPLQTASAGGAHMGAKQLSFETAPGASLTLELEPQTRLQTQISRMVPATRRSTTRVYRGQVAGHPQSWARLTRIGDAWLGVVQDQGRLWLLDPARFHAALAHAMGLDMSGTLVFTMDDIDGLDRFDAGAVLPPTVSPPAAATAVPAHASGETGRDGATVLYHLGVTLVLDTEFQSHYGGDANGVAIAILNVVDGFYSNQVDTDVYLYALEDLGSNGTLTSTDVYALLGAFRNYLTSAAVPFSGIAHLLSGKDFDTSYVGLAGVGTLCNDPYGSGVDQANFSAAASGVILAHEIGHNYGADHDGEGNTCSPSEFIMASVLNLGSPPTQFSTCSLDYFADYLATTAHQCLAAPPDDIFGSGFD